MASIHAQYVGDNQAGLQQLKSNLANLLTEKFSPPEPETLVEFIKRKGLKDPKPRSVKFYNAQVRKLSSGPYNYPRDADFQHRILIERQSPLFHFEAPDCIGDTPQFSSRGLTEWYVGEFCRLNKLKG
jgi:hypothetical protein